MFHIEFSFGELNMKLVMPESKIKDLLNLISYLLTSQFDSEMFHREARVCIGAIGNIRNRPWNWKKMPFGF